MSSNSNNSENELIKLLIFNFSQSSPEYYEHFTKVTLDDCETTRQKSVTLRGTLDAILINAARDLRSQADTVESALTARISCMDEVRIRLENELRTVLQNLADTEKTIDKLNAGIKNMDNPMKVVQTRLDNRNHRQHVENCRDEAQFNFIDEVKSIQDSVSALLQNLRDAENIKRNLMDTRGKLEQEIIYKRRSLMIDRERCMFLRSHFPSATALTGHS